MVKFIDYNKVIDQAMRSIVRKCLKYVETLDGKLPGNHHFYITFDLAGEGVKMSDRLRKMHQDQMTIVVQHQFWDLKVEEKKFAITLSFNNVRETLEIPFDSIISFADPSARFGLQFQTDEEYVVPEDEEGNLDSMLEDEIMKNLLDIDSVDNSDTGQKRPGKGKGSKESTGSKVISIDSFRKK